MPQQGVLTFSASCLASVTILQFRLHLFIKWQGHTSVVICLGLNLEMYVCSCVQICAHS